MKSLRTVNAVNCRLSDSFLINQGIQMNMERSLVSLRMKSAFLFVEDKNKNFLLSSDVLKPQL